MKEIILSSNKGIALIDDEDYEETIKYKWAYEHGYARRSGKVKDGKREKNIYLHRQVMNYPDISIDIDHKDRNKLNCQKDNLRLATRSQNAQNKIKLKIKGKECGFKYKGISKKDKKWASEIHYNNKKYWLGSYFSEIEAAIAYNEAATKYFGEFANLNIIEYKDFNDITNKIQENG